MREMFLFPLGPHEVVRGHSTASWPNVAKKVDETGWIRKPPESMSLQPTSPPGSSPPARVADKGLHAVREGTDVQESPSSLPGGRASRKHNERVKFTLRIHPSPRTQACNQVSCQVAHWPTQRTMGQEVPHHPLTEWDLNSCLLNKKQMRNLSPVLLSGKIPWSWRQRQASWSACRKSKHKFTTCFHPNGLYWQFHSDAKF